MTARSSRKKVNGIKRDAGVPGMPWKQKVCSIRRLAGDRVRHARVRLASGRNGARSRHRLNATYILFWEKTLPARRRRSQQKTMLH